MGAEGAAGTTMEYQTHAHPHAPGGNGNGTATGTDLFLPNGPYPIQQRRPDSHSHSSPAIRKVRPASFLPYKWFALGIFLALAIPGALIGWFSHKPKFEAFGTIEVTPIEQKLANENGRTNPMPFYKQALATLAENIRSPEVLARVLDQPEVKETKWFGKRTGGIFGTSASRLDRLRKQIKVRPQNDANFIRVAFECDSSADAQTIVTSVLNEFRVWFGDQKGKRIDKLQDLRDDKLINLRNEVQSWRVKINDIRSQLGTDDPSSLLDRQRIAEEEIRADLQRTDLEIEATRAAIAEKDKDEANVDSNDDAPTTAENERYYLQDSTWLDLNQRVGMVRDRLNRARDRFGPKSRQLLDMEADVDLIKGQLKDREMQIDKLVEMGAFESSNKETGIAGVYDLERRLKILETTREGIEKNLIAQREKVKQTLNQLTELEELEQSFRQAKQYYDALLDTKTTESIESSRPGMIQYVSEEAYAPSEPSNGKRRFLMVGLAIFGAAAVSVALTFARLLMNPQVSETSDLVDTTQSPILGFVPLLVEAKDMNPDAISTQTEHFRMVRTSLLERLTADTGVSLLITSAGPGAGKTTVTEQLGRSLTQCGKRVLLVDGDLRRQTLASRLNIRKEPGLLELLQGFAEERDVIVPGEVGEPDVIPAGRLDSMQNSELLATRKFKQLIDSMRPRYDIILIDGPPLLPIADARIIANSTDAAILVVREGHCRRGEVSFAVSTLTSAARKFLGTIFLGSPRSSGYPGYYSAYYGYNYGYGPGSGPLDRKADDDIVSGKRM